MSAVDPSWPFSRLPTGAVSTETHLACAITLRGCRTEEIGFLRPLRRIEQTCVRDFLSPSDMFWIVAALALKAASEPPRSAVVCVQSLHVSARILRGVEASASRRTKHQSNRIRTIIEKLPDGREISLTIYDSE